MMLGIWIFLLQAPPQKVQWWMWTLAIFFFLIGLGLLIYLMTRPKLSEQEEELESKPRKVLSDAGVGDADAEKSESVPVEKPIVPMMPDAWERWSDEVAMSAEERAVSTHSDAPQTTPEAELEALAESGTEILASSVQSHPIRDDKAEAKTNQTAALWNQATPEEKVEAVPTATIKDSETVSIPASEETVSLPSRKTSLISGGTSLFAEGTPTQRQPDVKETVRDAGTQVLASKQAQDEPPIVTTAAIEDDEVWQDLDFSQSNTAELATPTPQVPQPPAPPVSDKGTRPYNRAFPEQASASVSEPSSVDTLRTHTMREAFEPPRIEPIASPSPQPEMPLSPAVAPPAPSADTGTQAFSSTSRPTQVYSTEGNSTREFSAPQLPYETPIVQPTTHPEYETAQHGRISRPAGSVLGLPVDAPHTPLILGQPVKSRDEIGVTGFSNYDKPQDAGEKRRGGLIAILIVVALMGGGALMYFRVPAVHGWVDRLRGAEQSKAMDKARAQIIPAYPPEVNKKMVRAKGAVVNTSDQTLENLSVEVALYRGAVLDKTLTIPVTPEALEAGKQGEYVFEYDGGSAGYSRYSITKLTSNGSEVKFSIPKP